MFEERPDLLDVLYAPFHVDWRGDHPEGEQPWYDVPMLTAHDGRIAARVTNRSFMESVSRYGEELALSDAQREALDVFQEISNREELRLQMEFRKGICSSSTITPSCMPDRLTRTMMSRTGNAGCCACGSA
ncbi:unnamed protein product [Laminaria digitata]